MKNLKFLVKKANESLNEVIQYLESVQKCFQRMNLKLYDLNHALWSDKRFEGLGDNFLSDMFNLFCEDNYNWFVEWEQEEGIKKDIRNYIGRTSTFTLDSNGVFEDDGEFYLYTMLMEVFERYYDYRACDWVDGAVEYSLKERQLNYEAIQRYISSEREEYREEEIRIIKESLEYIIEGKLLEDIKDAVNDGVKEFEYIESFKENSIDYFHEFIQLYIEEKKEEEEF